MPIGERIADVERALAVGEAAALPDLVTAATSALNGNGEMTGTTWVDESGLLAGPVMVTNTSSVGVVRDARYGSPREKVPPRPESGQAQARQGPGREPGQVKSRQVE